MVNRSRERRWIFGALVAALCTLLPTLAWSQLGILTCVDVKITTEAAEPMETPALKRLVEMELERHRSHTVAGPGEGCISTLLVELIELPEGMGGGRFLTGRINGGVPHREPVKADMEVAIERTLRIILHNDPVRLRGPAQGNFLRRSLRTLRNEGLTYYGLEMYQWTGLLEGEAESLPGLAITARREVAGWSLGGRLAVAWSPNAPRERLEVRGRLGVHAEVRWHSNPKGDASFYFAPIIGLEYMRFEGPAPLVGPGENTDYSAVGLSGGLRVGAELFRITGARLDLFAEAALPAFTATDEDNEVVDAWVPSVSAGVGIVF
ncbi:MAG: hypothetical protein ACE366_05370 [Bradymonadia bacterium]